MQFLRLAILHFPETTAKPSKQSKQIVSLRAILQWGMLLEGRQCLWEVSRTKLALQIAH